MKASDILNLLEAARRECVSRCAGIVKLADAYVLHVRFHELWTEAVGQPGYDKADWRVLDTVVSRTLLDKFGSGWVDRARVAYKGQVKN